MLDISAIHQNFRGQCPRIRAFFHVCMDHTRLQDVAMMSLTVPLLITYFILYRVECKQNKLEFSIRNGWPNKVVS